ncbi:MAG: cytochrome b N-terminal domain-containing protein [Thermodesulfovibrionales bacterium]
MKTFLDWLDKSLAFSQRHKNFLERKIPAGLGYSYCLGGIAFTFFIFLVVSGLLLSLYYTPDEMRSYQSIVFITQDMLLGRIIRGVHKWSASLFIIFTILHSLRVFITRSYLPPRDLNWMTGALTLLFAMASGFTGYLLPWDQKAYWATEVGTSIFGTIPFVGEDLVYLIRGGHKISGVTLTRFYAIHVLYLPLIIGILLWGHFHMVKRLGIAKKL